MWRNLKMWLTFSPDFHCPITFQFLSNSGSYKMITIWQLPYVYTPATCSFPSWAWRQRKMATVWIGSMKSKISSGQSGLSAFSTTVRKHLRPDCVHWTEMYRHWLYLKKNDDPSLFPKSWYAACKQMIVQCWPESVNHPAHCLHRSVLNPNH